MGDKKSRRIECVVSVVVLLAAILILAVTRGGLLKEKSEKKHGQYNVSVSVVNEKGDYDKTYQYSTDEKTLGDLLVKEKLIEYENSDYGRYVTAVDGMKADDSKQEWWNVQVNGESAQTGIDGIELKDGEKYALILTTGY